MSKGKIFLIGSALYLAAGAVVAYIAESRTKLWDSSGAGGHAPYAFLDDGSAPSGMPFTAIIGNVFAWPYALTKIPPKPS